MSRMAMQFDRKFWFCYRDKSDEKSDPTVASEGSGAWWWEGQHRMGKGRMRALSLPFMWEPAFQRRPNLPSLQKTSCWRTGWFFMKESQKNCGSWDLNLHASSSPVTTSSYNVALEIFYRNATRQTKVRKLFCKTKVDFSLTFLEIKSIFLPSFFLVTLINPIT